MSTPTEPPSPRPSPEAIAAALARSELFRAVPEADLAEVAALAAHRSIEDGGLIVREDDEAKELFLILDGRADVQVRWPFAAGDHQQIGQVRRGDVVGEVALVDRFLRSASVRAIGRVEVIALPFDGLRTLLERTPVIGFRVMENVARLLATRMRETNLKLRNTIANLLY